MYSVGSGLMNFCLAGRGKSRKSDVNGLAQLGLHATIDDPETTAPIAGAVSTQTAPSGGGGGESIRVKQGKQTGRKDG